MEHSLSPRSCPPTRYEASSETSEVWALIKLQALVYDILPSTTAVFSYAMGSTEKTYRIVQELCESRGDRPGYTPSTAFRHLPPNSARVGGQLHSNKECPFNGITDQIWQFGGRCRRAMLGVWALTQDCGSGLAPKHPRQPETHLPW